MVETRARVTASNNVFSPLCVLAAERERARGGTKRKRGDGEQSYPRARAVASREGALAYTPSAINFVNTACCGRGTRGVEKGMKRGSLSRPRLPLALFPLFSIVIPREGLLMDFYVRTTVRHRSHRNLLFPPLSLARVLIKGIM